MIHKTFSFLFIAIFFLIFCLSSTTSCTRLLQARRAIMADDDNGDYNEDNNNNNNNNDASSPAIPPEYVGIPMRPHSSKPDHSATDQHPPPAVIHPPPAHRAIMADYDYGDYNQNNNNNNDDDYNDASSPAIPPEYVGIPMRPHSSKPDHSATDQHPPPAVIHPPPATPTACSGMDRQELENCIRRQVNRDLCKNYNIC